MANIELLNAKKVKKRTRQTVDLPCVLDQRLTELAFEHGMSKSDVIRDAVKLLVEYDRLRKEGYDTVSQKQHSDGTKEFVRVSIGV